MQQIVRAQLDRMGEFHIQMLRVSGTSAAVIDALAQPRFPQPPAEDR